MKVNAIITCGGSGTRAQLGKNKILHYLGAMPLIAKTLSAFFSIEGLTKIILPCAKQDLEAIGKIVKNLQFDCDIQLCLGGDTRTKSVMLALENLENDCDIVIIHDGARPDIDQVDIQSTIASAQKFGSGILASECVDTIAETKDGKLSRALIRDSCVRILTPQTFDAKKILLAYSKITKDDSFTDDSGVYNKYIAPPQIVITKNENKKYTLPQDFKPHLGFRVGCGYDTHALVEGRDLILGGIKIEHTKGLLGHSDADALVHAVMDALLTACDERDIGYHFPDSDNAYKNIDSCILLEQVCKIIEKKGYVINNISAVIMAQKPKLAQYIPKMREKLARVMQINQKDIAISATTTEGLGFIGREEGIAVNAICSVFDEHAKNN